MQVGGHGGEWGDDTRQRLKGVDTGTGRGRPHNKTVSVAPARLPNYPFARPRPKTPAWSEPNKITAVQDG